VPDVAGSERQAAWTSSLGDRFGLEKLEKVRSEKRKRKHWPIVAVVWPS